MPIERTSRIAPVAPVVPGDGTDNDTGRNGERYNPRNLDLAREFSGRGEIPSEEQVPETPQVSSPGTTQSTFQPVDLGVEVLVQRARAEYDLRQKAGSPPVPAPGSSKA